jgi:multiple sugar transport system ATP-binding protein
MRLPADTPIASGQSLRLRLPADKLNLFDAASGRRL